MKDSQPPQKTEQRAAASIQAGGLGIALVAPVAQMTNIDVNYNAGQGRLRSSLRDLAQKNEHWYNSFPADAFDAIVGALDALPALDETEAAYVVTIRARVAAARQVVATIAGDVTTLHDSAQAWYDSSESEVLTAILNRVAAIVPATDQARKRLAAVKAKARIAKLNKSGFTANWSGETVTGKLRNGNTVATFEFSDYDEDGRYWIWHMDTNAEYQNRGIGVFLIKSAVERYGAVYASRAGKNAHEENDEDDIRYLSAEGAALVNACIRAGIMNADWLVDPFFEAENDSDD